jgi:hypothetical protein
MMSTLRERGISSEIAYAAGVVSVALSMLSWAGSLKGERSASGDLARADRWGIFVGLWAPTFFALGNAMKIEETHSHS